MLYCYLFISTISAAIYYSEEDLIDGSDLILDAEVTSASFLSYSVDSQGIEDIRYEATLSVLSMSKGDITEPDITLYSHMIEQESCAWYDMAHSIGEKGLYYIVENNGVYELHPSGFISATDSNPEDDLECPVVEEPSSEPTLELMDERNDTVEEKSESCNHNDSSFSFVIFTMLLILLRRK
jgi:hypothetical protein